MIKKISLGLLSIIFGLSLFGCKPNDPFENIEVTVDDPSTLTLMAEKVHVETTYVQRIAQLYKEKTGKQIKFIGIENNKFEATSTKLFSQGKIPDLFFHFNDAELARYSPSENFYYLNDEQWIGELTDMSLAYSKDVNGNVLGLPFWENSLSGCYYNKTILQKKGLGRVTTQAAFDSLCDLLNVANTTPLYWVGSDGGHWMFQFGLDPIFADQPDGPQLLSKLNSGELKYSDIEGVRKMVEWFNKAKTNFWFNSDYASKSYDDIAPAMANGEAAMFFIWDTYFSTTLKGYTDSHPDSKYKAEDFGLMPIFMNTTKNARGNYGLGNGTYEGGNLNLMLVNKKSKKRDLALDFLKFCATPENYNVAFKDIITFECFKNQTTNIQSPMIDREIQSSIKDYTRPSTAWTKINGYVQNDMGNAVLKLFSGSVDVNGCLNLMDELRIKAKRS